MRFKAKIIPKTTAIKTISFAAMLRIYLLFSWIISLPILNNIHFFTEMC